MLKPDQRAICVAIDCVEDVIAGAMGADASPEDRMTLALFKIGQLSARPEIASLPSELQSKISRLIAKPDDQVSTNERGKWSRDLLGFYCDLILATH